MNISSSLTPLEVSKMTFKCTTCGEPVVMKLEGPEPHICTCKCNTHYELRSGDWGFILYTDLPVT